MKRIFHLVGFSAAMIFHPLSAAPLNVHLMAGHSNMRDICAIHTFPHGEPLPVTKPIDQKMVNPDGSPWAHENVWISATGCAKDGRPGQLTTGYEVSSTDPPAQAGAVNASPVPGEVRKIDEDHHTVGGVTLRTSTREISFDAQVNQTGGLIEFLLVTDKGKIHESLFSCAIRPTDLNIAFKLLGYPSSPELFAITGPDHRPTGQYPEVPEEVKSGARLAISASWQDGGGTTIRPVNELVKNTSTGSPMPSGPWLYTGSLIHQGVFRAEATGDLIAVFSNPTAMLNYPGDARTNDEVWSVNPGTVPAKGTPVRITIKPFSTTAPDKKP